MMHVLAALLLAIALAAPCAARADIPDDKIKIGVLQDISGADAARTGDGGIVAAQLAASDFETKYLRGDVEILAPTKRGSPDADVDQVREWLDKEHVAAVVSPAGLGVDRQIAPLLAQHHAALLVAGGDDGAAVTACGPNVVNWQTDVQARLRATVQVITARGEKRWYVVANQSPAGIAELNVLQSMLPQYQAQLVGQSVHPLGTVSLAQLGEKAAQAKAQVVALAEGDGDLVAALRASADASLRYDMTVAAPLAHITDIDQTGPALASGVVVATPFYWDTNAQTRDFARRWSSRMEGRQPTADAAEIYAATLSYAHAAKAVEDVDVAKVLGQLRRAPIQHTLFGTVTIRADGQAVYDVGVFQVRRPDQIHQSWAYYRLMEQVPGKQAFGNSCAKADTERTAAQ